MEVIKGIEITHLGTYTKSVGKNDNYKLIVGRSKSTNTLIYFMFINGIYTGSVYRMSIEDKNWWGIKNTNKAV